GGGTHGWNDTGWPPARVDGNAASGRRYHRQGQARNAGQAATGVFDADFPDLGAASEMQGAGGAGDPAFAHGADVVGVDLEADADLALGHAHVAGAAAQGFGQEHRSAAVEQAVGLEGAGVDRHGGDQAVVADVDEFDAQGLDRGALRQG